MAVHPRSAAARLGNISYIEPRPASGIAFTYVLSDGPQGSGVTLIISNGRSERRVDAETGQVILKDGEELLGEVDERDREAFERFISSVELIAQ